MNNKILINAVDPAECRIAKVKESKLEEFHIESAAREITQGNIYKAVVSRIEPSLQAAFIDYGAERHGFLPKQEIHYDYFQENNSANRSIQSMIKRGQELLVQIIKDPIMKKGAMLTTLLSLPGRHLVLMPGSETRGISRKIEDVEERDRLKKIVQSLKLQEGYGMIVRTAGEKCTKTVLAKDLRYLMRLWKNIKGNVMEVASPTLLYKERNLVLRSLRDYYTPDITEILIDNEAIFREVKNFIQIISAKDQKIVKLYKGSKPIFTKFELESQIASIFENRVLLKSGGSIVIEQTEALVSIDVNSGKSTHESSVEQTAYVTNQEAAEEIARQLRLRDLGGLIVLDFIDMRNSKHKIQVEKTLKTHLKQDKAKTKVGRLSKFGLLEMSRQRIRPSIQYGSHETCKCCQGKGLVPSVETSALSFLRKLSLEVLKGDPSHIRGIVPVEVAAFLLNHKRKEILDLEARRHLGITIEGDAGMTPGESNVIATKAIPANAS